MGRITLGKRTPSRGKRYGATSRIRRYHVEITHMDWPRAVLHTGVSEVDSARLGWGSYTAEWGRRFLPGKDTGSPRGGSRTVEEYNVGSPKGNHYTRAPSPAQGLTLGNVRVLDPGVWCSATPDCRGCGRNFNRVRRGELNWEATGASIRSVEGNGAASVIDTERVSSVTGHPRQVHGRTLALYGDCKTSQTY